MQQMNLIICLGLQFAQAQLFPFLREKEAVPLGAEADYLPRLSVCAAQLALSFILARERGCTTEARFT
jgi:hypothetical protein